MKIGMIGLGNMGEAILSGILEKGIVKKEEVIGSAASRQTTERIAKTYGIAVTLDNREVACLDVVILAVKPQYLEDVIGQIRDIVKANTLLITIAAGKCIEWYEQAFGKEIKLVRCMPNTPAMVGEGCSAVCANQNVTETERELVLELLGSLGRTYIIREGLIDAFSAIAGSSPAYVFMFLEAMADAGVAAGMPRGQAIEVAAQAVLGSAKLLLETGKHPGELKDMVCSPGGTTIQGVRTLEEQGMRGAVIDALLACVERAGKL